MADIAQTLDASGLACPMPVVKTRMAISALEPGQVLEVISTDRGSLTDIPSWCESTGNTLLSTEDRDGRFVFLIERG